MEIIDHISSKLNIEKSKVSAVLDMLDQGATIPFMARYRKERTGALDEVILTDIRDLRQKMQELLERKKAILKSLEERELLTRDLKEKIETAPAMANLEDLYEKYRPKKRTRAIIAREKGLEPLGRFLLEQTNKDPLLEAKNYINPEKQVTSCEDALSYARDIIAEIINEDTKIRSAIRRLFIKEAAIESKLKKGKEEDALKFKDYFEWSEPASKAPSHRILAMLRGAKEGFLTVHVLPDEKKALQIVEHTYVKNSSPSALQVKIAARDAYKRLLLKSIEKEMVNTLKEKADEKAITVFTDNLKELLLSPPLGQKSILAIDPGFRTGCKVVCLDSVGKLLHHDVIFPHQKDTAKAQKIIRDLTSKYRIEAVAIGNGTAGRETESFVKSLKLTSNIQIVMVDESGASIYSASSAARDEFPDHDITVRGAVSIGRRLMDPLAELVKIDPKSIGVGQYQHDVDQKHLAQSLNDVVEVCVNKVGVEVNTASKDLLQRVSGLNATIAANIVMYRDENGPFSSRVQLKKVARLGPKAFEQSAGFLRIHEGKNPLDRSGIHPESYGLVKKMAEDADSSLKELLQNPIKVKKLNLKNYMTKTIGMPTLNDIATELLRPGRDPRKAFTAFSFDDTIHDIKDLIPGMKVPGIVTNVTAFGAFVDIGVHQDGLVHISQLADRFVKDPNEIVSVRQQIHVTVLEVDIKRKRISLSMKKHP
ncbi:MAG: RNA-binding transcriptional accessory protein [Desulfobacteraceae bacterium]|nr:RNA-binding transcriptional accessory protein [Desulfobacteraceae bacterium]